MNQVSNEAKFYVVKPVDDWWTSINGSVVIQAISLNKNDLKVIAPKDFEWKQVSKIDWAECPGPVRKLNFKDYVELYHSLEPSRPLPKDWKK